MIEDEIAQCLAVFRRGLVTLGEFSHTVLWRIARSNRGVESVELLAALPAELQDHIKEVLKQIEMDDFMGTPVVIGAEWSAEELAELRNQIRIIHSTLGV